MQELCWICGSICVHTCVQKRERMLKLGNRIIWQLCSDLHSPDLAICFKRHHGILFWDPVEPPTVHSTVLFSLYFLKSCNISKLVLSVCFQINFDVNVVLIQITKLTAHKHKSSGLLVLQQSTTVDSCRNIVSWAGEATFKLLSKVPV